MTPPMNSHQKPQEEVVGLLPCPFCGSNDVELRENITDEMVACNNCGARSGLIYLGAEDTVNAARRRELIAAWNTRTTLSYEAGRRDMREEAGWQPIETAPKDGTHVLLYGSAKWLGRGTHALDTGWYCEIAGEGHWITDASRSPTHWQPLPTEPLGGEG